MKRLEFIDALKGLAIFCVLWGHSIQYLRNDLDFFHNSVFEYIYSFHMPLFFLLSGFFFQSSLHLTCTSFVQKKSIQLLLPCFVWAMLYVIFELPFQEHGQINWNVELLHMLNPLRWPFWFLKELFISYFLLYVNFKLFKKEWLVYMISIGFVLIAPYCENQRLFLPIFIAGIMLRNNYAWFLTHLNKILYTAGFIYGICLFFLDDVHTIYTTGFPELFHLKTLSMNISNVGIPLYRLLTGLSGSIFLTALFQKTYSKNIFYSLFEKIGTYTLGIYILQATLLENALNKIIDFPNVNIFIYNFGITPIISLFVLGICIAILELAGNFNYINLLLFGNSIDKKLS